MHGPLDSDRDIYSQYLGKIMMESIRALSSECWHPDYHSWTAERVFKWMSWCQSHQDCDARTLELWHLYGDIQSVFGTSMLESTRAVYTDPGTSQINSINSLSSVFWLLESPGLWCTDPGIYSNSWIVSSILGCENDIIRPDCTDLWERDDDWKCRRWQKARFLQYFIQKLA